MAGEFSFLTMPRLRIPRQKTVGGTRSETDDEDPDDEDEKVDEIQATILKQFTADGKVDCRL